MTGEAKQSILSSCGEMDCFASLAMTWRARPHPPLSSSAKAGDPVRRGFSVLSSASLEYLYGVWSRDSLSGHFNDLLVRRGPTSPRLDLKTAGRPGGATVKGGRRPSRSDVALDGREPGGRLEVETRRCRWRHEDDFRGEPALDAISRRRLVFG